MALIKDNVQKILSELPEGVELVAATKSRSVEEILEAIDSGVKIIGENYVREAEKRFSVIGTKVRWHLIGHLQKNKVRRAVRMFDMIETVDSIEIAMAIDKACMEESKIMPVLVEINSAKEKDKSGVLPEEVEGIARYISGLKNVRLTGLMTMGPLLGNPEDYRPYFRDTRLLFDRIRAISLPNVDMRHLSMGMSDSYNIAIEQGANIVRIGTRIFEER